MKPKGTTGTTTTEGWGTHENTMNINENHREPQVLLPQGGEGDQWKSMKTIESTVQIIEPHRHHTGRAPQAPQGEGGGKA